MITLRPARSGEAAALTDLCLRSKAVWGYDAAFLEACRDELTISEAEIVAGRIQVAEVDGKVAAMAQIEVADDVAVLDKLFVDPPFIGNGLGEKLYRWAADEARKGGAARLLMDADPGAADFYRRMGATDSGEVPSAARPGRFIPRLIATLA